MATVGAVHPEITYMELGSWTAVIALAVVSLKAPVAAEELFER